MDVAQALNLYLGEHGIKQSFLAERCGWSKQKTNTIVRGKKKMAAEEMASVCDALGLPYDFFFKRAMNQGA